MSPHDDRGPARRREPAQRPGTAPNRLRPGSGTVLREVPPELSGDRAGLGKAARRRGFGAGLAALALHALLLVVLAHRHILMARSDQAPIPVTILPAPPPPPPPLSGATAEAPVPKPEPVVEPQPESEHARIDAIKLPRETKKPRPKTRPTPAPVQQAESGGSSEGKSGGVEGGVVGGTVGGVDGGQVGGLGDAPISANQVASPPTLLSQVRPRYPQLARVRGLEGVVTIEMIVGRDGKPEADSVRIRQSAPSFDEAAIEAVRQWRFQPGRDAAGNPVRVILEVPIRFQLR